MMLHRFTAPLKSGPGVGVRLEAKSALGGDLNRSTQHFN